MKQGWKFFDYIDGNGNNPIEEWYQNDLSENAKVVFRKTLKTTYKIEIPQHWGAFKRFLRGECKEHRIWELEFVSDGRQYRILSIFGPNRKQVTLLVGCYHKMNVYSPKDTLRTACDRAKALSEGKAKYCERKIEDY